MRKIALIDSGVGGLTTLKECVTLMPSENYIYIYDRSFLPYGTKSAEELLNRSFCLYEFLAERGVKAVMLACNTLTNVAVDYLRNRYDNIFVGVEPAVKPAVKNLKWGKALVLVTELAAAQPKFKKLIDASGQRIIVAPQRHLALEIENNIENLDVIRPQVKQIISAYKDIESVVLGCTHYVYLRPMIKNLFPQLKIYDGNAGAAKRLKYLLESRNLLSPDGEGGVEFIST